MRESVRISEIERICCLVLKMYWCVGVDVDEKSTEGRMASSILYQRSGSSGPETFRASANQKLELCLRF